MSILKYCHPGRGAKHRRSGISSIIYASLILLASLALSACLSPASVPPETRYVLEKTPKIKRVARRPINIMVQLPASNTIYETMRMAYTREEYQLGYYSLNLWAASPAHMVQGLLVSTLQSSNRFNAVLTPPFIGHYNYLLLSQIQDFKMNFTRYPATFDLRMRFQLISMKSYRVLGSKEIFIMQPMSQESPVAGVHAANLAVMRALQQANNFIANIVH